MKACEKCGDEIATKDGDNRCARCDDKARKGASARRREKDALLRSCGLTKVRGALGGTYWE